jgi:hypothetical protein
MSFLRNISAERGGGLFALLRSSSLDHNNHSSSDLRLWNTSRRSYATSTRRLALSKQYTYLAAERYKAREH